ncbi:MAG: ATP-dependent sacrificial sulfur transferase LarE [Treponema sp.]|nr:ATP-dependent sacrificial sulfur transferase LarE [Treponema sp.]
MKLLNDKLIDLRYYLESLERVAVAFSSGVDSTFLLKVAHDVLGDNAVAVTASSHSFPSREQQESIEFCKKENIRHILFEINELEIPGFDRNPKNRCYLCKKDLFSHMIAIASENGISCVCEGSNVDDMGDYRPGLQAVAELGVKSPLRYCGLHKQEIRALSKEMGLSTWEKPSFACLASRFVYGQTITAEKLGMVDKAEQLLVDLGFLQERVRIHDTLARIEVLPDDFMNIIAYKDEIVDAFKKIGFTYVSLDLQGYRTGSMNETLRAEIL